MTENFCIREIGKLKYVLLLGFLYFLCLNPAFSESYTGRTEISSSEVKADNHFIIKHKTESEVSVAQEIFNIYYISISGNNNNSGLSPAEAWQTIAKVNSTNFEPGDRILFEGGKTFYGNLVFDFSDDGSPGNFIQIGSFGTDRAIINAGNGSGLTAVNCDFLKIKNIDFVGNGRKTGNTGNGLSFSYCTNIVIDSVNVSKFQHSGIIALNQGNNLSFTNINATENGFAGIFINGLSKTSLSDIYIGYCNAENNPGDPTVTNNHSGNGILAFNAKNVLIEYCSASNNGWDMPRTGNGPGGIWFAEVDSSIIQYCISHDNKTSVGGQDGLGFDLDGGTTNSIIQYCLSYNNQGAGYGIFQYSGASNWYNNIIRYCVSENDGNVSARGSVLFWNGSNNSSKFQGLEFYNNVIYNKNGVALAFLDHLNSNFNFRNNIFVSKNKSVYNSISTEKFQGNCWYSLDSIFYLNTALDFNTWAVTNNQEMYNGSVVGIFANPKFVNPGNTNLIDPRLLGSLEGYKLENISATINKGLNLTQLFGLNTGNRDFFGNPGITGSTTDMGIYEYQGTVIQPDIVKPVITSLFLTETSASLVVPVTSFTATDNVGVTGYKLTETPVAPLAGDAGWSAVAPAVYTFNTEGLKTLYAWAKDAAGNVSAGISDTVVITLTANDTISVGNTEVYSNIIKWGNQLAMPVTLSEGGKIVSVSVYHEGGTGNLLLGVYSDQSGYPSSRLGITASTVINTTAGWQTVLLTSPVSVISGQKVWLSWVFQNNPGIRYTTGTPGRAVSSYTWSAGMPAAFGTSTIAGTKYSIFCNFITQIEQLKSLNSERENQIITEVKPQVIYYPNPTSEIINIELNNIEIKNLKLTLYTMQGTLIKELLIESEYIEINISDLKSGVYFAVMSENEKGLIFNSARIIVNR